MSDASTNAYIVGPLAVLLLLGLPMSESGETYNWPFYHRIKCPGIWDLNAAYISSISVVKGGDQQQISHNQRLGIVDVRLEIGSLYSSILAAPTLDGRSRPTLQSYLEGLVGEQKITTPYDYSKPGKRSQTTDDGITTSGTTSSETPTRKNQASPRQGNPQTSLEDEASSRTSPTVLQRAANLITGGTYPGN